MSDFFEFLKDVVHLQGVGAVFLLVGVMIATTLVQQRVLGRNDAILKTVSPRVRETEHYETALAYVTRRMVPNPFVSETLSLPVWSLVIVVASCSIGAFFGAELFYNGSTPSYMLGGALAADPDTAFGTATDALIKYQSETAFTATMAFFGAYIWTIGRLITRINNNDISPTTYYFLSIRILTACLIAGIGRHVLEALPVPLNDILYRGDLPVGLAVFGFIVGWNPTLWIDELYNRGSELLRRNQPVQRQPAQPNFPENMTLAMIQGLIDHKIERLMELDIDNCQRLACENPVIIWLRTNYNLEHIADWVAQAQLCVLFENDKLQALRRNGIRDIFSYKSAMDDASARAAVQAIVQIPLAIVNRHAAILAANPAFRRLDQLRRALFLDELDPPAEEEAVAAE